MAIHLITEKDQASNGRRNRGKYKLHCPDSGAAYAPPQCVSMHTSHVTCQKCIDKFVTYTCVLCKCVRARRSVLDIDRLKFEDKNLSVCPDCEAKARDLVQILEHFNMANSIMYNGCQYCIYVETKTKRDTLVRSNANLYGVCDTYYVLGAEVTLCKHCVSEIIEYNDGDRVKDLIKIMSTTRTISGIHETDLHKTINRIKYLRPQG